MVGDRRRKHVHRTVEGTQMIDDIKRKILSQSTAIRTRMLPEVWEKIRGIEPDYDGVKPYQTSIVDWLKPMVDLSGFHVYPINGITEGLNWWYNREHRHVSMDSGDYQWIESKPGHGGEIRYQSIPSSIDGNMRDVVSDKPVALDLAYVGTTGLTRIELGDNVEYVFYSLSKAFGVRNARSGWMFTRTRDPKLESLAYGAKYYNYIASAISECILENFDISYVHGRLKQSQRDICDALGLTPSDSVWIANSDDPDYTKFRRSGDAARICLSEVYVL